MSTSITISEYLSRAADIPLLDVRSPGEFEHAHIPGALSLPLFSNEERANVGMTYKQQGREAAILLGFDVTAPKWSGMINRALELAPKKTVAVHCWRGGMRSEVVAWVLKLYGFNVQVISGGYKSYRHLALELFAQPFEFRVIGGMTGSGKTRILREMELKGKQILDLEKLANHQGSVYGTLNKYVQPSQEQFENDLAFALLQLDKSIPIWVEDESLNIGRCRIPLELWNGLQLCTLFDLIIPDEHRVSALVEEYGSLDKDFLIECTERIRKRLGPQHYRQATTAIEENRMDDFIKAVLIYYDKTYRKALTKRNSNTIRKVELDSPDANLNATTILNLENQFKTNPILNE